MQMVIYLPVPGKQGFIILQMVGAHGIHRIWDFHPLILKQYMSIPQMMMFMPVVSGIMERVSIIQGMMGQAGSPEMKV